MLSYVEYRKSVMPKEVCNKVTARKCFKEYIMDCAKTPAPFGINYLKPYLIELGNCPTATTACTPISGYEEQKQGNNPMRVTETSATVSVAAAVSDESKQRDYLLSELDEAVRYSWKDSKYAELRKQFNIGTPTVPETPQALLDAFSTGAFTVDQKKVDRATKYAKDGLEDEDDSEYPGSRFYGITFTGLPVADRKGYDAAVAAYEKAKKDTKRAIIVGSPADGLTALLALEAWTPATGTVAS